MEKRDNTGKRLRRELPAAHAPRRGAFWLGHSHRGGCAVGGAVRSGVPSGRRGLWSIGIAYIAYDTLLLAFVVWQTLPLRRTTPPQPATGGPSVGVLIAAYDEAPVLPATLRALLAQTEPPEEIVVADDGSATTPRRCWKPSSVTAVRRCGCCDCRTAARPPLLNSALLAVDTDVVVTMDADTLPEPDAIAAHPPRLRGRPRPGGGGRRAQSRCAGGRSATGHFSGSRPTSTSATSSPATHGCG